MKLPKANKKKWLFLKKQILAKIRTDPDSPFKEIIDKGDYVILVDADNQEYKITPSVIK